MVLPAVSVEAAHRFGDTPAFIAAGGWPVSYADLDRLSDEVAGGLAGRGTEEGSVVALTLPSTPEYVITYLAAAKLGAVTAGVNPRFTGPERAAALDAVGPDLVIGTTETLVGVADDLEGIEIELAGAVDLLLAELRSVGDQPDPLPDDPDRPVAVVLTSGTTGTPKGALFTNRQLAAITAADVGDQWGGGGFMVPSTQFAHVGFMTKLAWYLRLATTTPLLARWRAGKVLDLIEHHRISTVGAVAPQVALLLRDPTFDDRDLECVTGLVVGAGPSPPALVAEARSRFGAGYSIRYSSTESGGVGTATEFDADDEEALFTVGRPRGGVELEVRDDQDRVLPDGEVGELCLRSPAQMAGYWRQPEATAATLAGGWLHTGDLARVDDRGLVRLAGRNQEMFIRGGYNVYPMEVEAVLASHPGVREVAVVPRADPIMGEIGVAVVVARRPTDPPELDDLRSFAADHLSSYKLPEAIRSVAELPLTPMQKLDRVALAAEEARSDHDERDAGAN